MPPQGHWNPHAAGPFSSRVFLDAGQARPEGALRRLDPGGVVEPDPSPDDDCHLYYDLLLDYARAVCDGRHQRASLRHTLLRRSSLRRADPVAPVFRCLDAFDRRAGRERQFSSESFVPAGRPLHLGAVQCLPDSQRRLLVLLGNPLRARVCPRRSPRWRDWA